MSRPGSDQAGIRQVIRALKASGHTLVSCENGGEPDEVEPYRNEDQAVAALTETDESWLNVKTPDGRDGWVWFVLGNPDPEDLVADYTTNLDPTIDVLTRGWWS